MTATRRPLDLTGSGLRIGMLPQAPLAMRQDAPRRLLGLDPSQPAAPRRPDAVSMAYALSGTPTVESGSIAEAIAAALEGGIRGRAAWDERRVELDERDRVTREREARESAQAAALEAFNTNTDDPAAQERAVIAALGQGDRESALSMALGGLERRQEAEAPLTRAQQAQLKGQHLDRQQSAQEFTQQQETQRRGQDLDYAAAIMRARGAAQVEGGVAGLFGMLDNVAEARAMGSGEHGLVGAAAGAVPGSRAHRLRQSILPSLRSNLALEALLDLRAAGGTLGSVTERELTLLESRIAALNPDVNEREFERQLGVVDAHVRRSIGNIIDAAERDAGGPTAQTQALRRRLAEGGPVAEAETGAQSQRARLEELRRRHRGER